METQGTFDAFKTGFVDWCKAKSACEPEFKKVLAAKTEPELLAVIHANFQWCMGQGFDAGTLKVLGDDVLFAAKIVVGDFTGKRLEEGVWCVAQSQVKAYGSSQVKAYGSSQVEAYGSSQVEAYGSSQVEAYGSSQVKAYGSSQVKAYGSSQVKAYGSSQVEAWDSSQVKAYGSSQVKAYGSSQVKAYAWAIIHVRKNGGHALELGGEWTIDKVTIMASGEQEEKAVPEPEAKG
jgi:hypothetical protein